MQVFIAVYIIVVFPFNRVFGKCQVLKSIATCDSVNVPPEVYQGVNFLQIKNDVSQSFLSKYVFRYSNFDKLSIYNCSLKTIRTNTFVDLNISYLALMENNIEILETGAFKNLTKLDKLLLRHNKIKIIQKSVLTNLPVSVLSLSFNLISSIEDSALENLPSLKKLHLDSNRLDNIFVHKVIDDPSSLETLWLHNNSLRLVTNYMLKGLKNLQILNLGFNNIETIEDGTFQQTPKLQTLVLTNNRIKDIDGGVFPRQGLTDLKILYLDNNELMFLSTSFFFRLNGLEKITLVGNPWLCPCLNIITRILYDNKIKEKCQYEYNTGGKPVCVTEPSMISCTYKYDSGLKNRYFYVKNLDSSVSKRPCFL